MGIVLRPPLLQLLREQKARTYLGRPNGRVFPGLRGPVMSYHEWLKRGWTEAIRRAGVSPREGDAQKALRKSYVTSSLICGRNLKLVSEELGHATTRMVMETYDSFVGPDAWPEAAEIDSLRAIYGWADLHLDRAPSGPN